MVKNMDYMREIGLRLMRAGGSLYELAERIETENTLFGEGEDVLFHIFKNERYNRENDLYHKFLVTMTEQERSMWDEYLTDESSKE